MCLTLLPRFISRLHHTQIASSMLNMGPAYTMQMAERLYIQVGNYPQMPLMIELKTSVDIAQFNVF